MPERFDRRANVASTALLSLAALGASWSGYQASVWNGNQVSFANAAIALRTHSAHASSVAGQMRIVDVSVFTSWLDAYARHDTVLSNFYIPRFRPEFARAFHAWAATKPMKTPTAPPTPFAMPEYRLAATDEALRLERAADSVATLSATANGHSDGFVLDAVLFATVMAFGGAAQQQRRHGARLFLLTFAGVMWLAGLVRLATSPLG